MVVQGTLSPNTGLKTLYLPGPLATKEPLNWTQPTTLMSFFFVVLSVLITLRAGTILPHTLLAPTLKHKNIFFVVVENIQISKGKYTNG